MNGGGRSDENEGEESAAESREEAESEQPDAEDGGPRAHSLSQVKRLGRSLVGGEGPRSHSTNSKFISKAAARMHDETQRKLKDFDFNYLFHRGRKQRYLDLCIQAVNSLYHEERKWLRHEITQLGISFVFRELTNSFPRDSSMAEDGCVDRFDLNKMAWSKLLLKQPQI